MNITFEKCNGNLAVSYRIRKHESLTTVRYLLSQLHINTHKNNLSFKGYIKS